MKQKEIAKELNISKYIVSRVVTKDTRYEEEKEKRKQESINRHNRKKTESILKKQHIEASKELSGGKKYISNRAFRNWNTSIYRYDRKTKSYKLKNNINVSKDIPRRIKW